MPVARTTGESGHRQAPRPRLAPRAASTRAISAGHGGVRLEDLVVDEHAGLLLDDAEELHALERVQGKVRGEARRGQDGRGRNAGEAGDDHGDRIDLGVERVAGQLGGRRGDGRRRRPGNLVESRQDVRLADLEGVGPGQVLVRPDGGAADLLVGRQADVRRGHDIRRHAGIVEQQDRVDTQVRSQRPADDGCVLDPRVLAEDRLDVLRVDLLAVGERQHVLLAAAEGEHPVRRDRPEVAHVVPAVGVDRGGGRLGVLPVAEEAARAAGQDLAVVGDPDLDARDRLTDRPEDVALRPREGDDGAHLRGAVALQDVDAHVGPALGDVDVEGRCPDADRVQAPAELREDPPEEQSPDGFGTRPATAWSLFERCSLRRPGPPAARSRRRAAAGPAGTMSSVDTPKSRKVRTRTAGWRLTG